MSWSDERVEILKDAWARGRSCTQIGVLLGVSRNSAISKIHRLGLSGRIKAPAPANPVQRNIRRATRALLPPREKAPKAQPNFAAVNAVRRVERLAASPGFAEEPPIPAPTSVLVTIVDLKSCMCKWPLGDPLDLESFRYCGAATQADPDVAYCTTHRAIAYVPGRYEQRRAAA